MGIPKYLIRLKIYIQILDGPDQPECITFTQNKVYCDSLFHTRKTPVDPYKFCELLIPRNIVFLRNDNYVLITFFSL